jgi:hypothetical protein
MCGETAECEILYKEITEKTLGKVCSENCGNPSAELEYAAQKTAP